LRNNVRITHYPGIPSAEKGTFVWG
jgi:hypothetical protein